MSKKKIAAVFAGALVVALALPTVALAAPGGGFGQLFASCQGQGLGMAVMRSQATVDQACGRAFVDADGGGVCDNFGSGRCAGYVDADDDGVCDACGAEANACGGYRDADGDGVCDNYATGSGCGRGFADENDGGVCDNGGRGGCGAGAGQGAGSGHGGRHHRL